MRPLILFITFLGFQSLVVLHLIGSNNIIVMLFIVLYYRNLQDDCDYNSINVLTCECYNGVDIAQLLNYL